jgi:hypothetical protein
MSEVDRLSNSGLYPALPIADRRPSRNGSGGGPGGKQPPDKPKPPQKGDDSKSLIDEYA